MGNITEVSPLCFPFLYIFDPPLHTWNWSQLSQMKQLHLARNWCSSPPMAVWLWLTKHMTHSLWPLPVCNQSNATQDHAHSCIHEHWACFLVTCLPPAMKQLTHHNHRNSWHCWGIFWTRIINNSAHGNLGGDHISPHQRRWYVHTKEDNDMVTLKTGSASTYPLLRMKMVGCTCQRKTVLPPCQRASTSWLWCLITAQVVKANVGIRKGNDYLGSLYYFWQVFVMWLYISSSALCIS